LQDGERFEYMSINAILATDLNFGIGKEGNLPWPKNERDMTWFREHTMGHVVVMGRKTWESIGSKPLPKRINVVITSKTLEGSDLTMSGDMEQILDHLKEIYEGLHIWIIGGAEIYFQAIPLCDKLYLTTINNKYDCDTHVESDIITKFPVIEHWQEDPEITFQIRRRM
jgi:dihydrofolate reductase